MKPSMIREETAGDFASQGATQRVLGELGETSPAAPPAKPEPREPQKHTGQLERDALDDLH